MYRWGRGAVKLAPLRRRSRGERAKTPCADAVAPRALPCADTVAPWRIVGLTTIMGLLPVAAWACAVCFEGDDALARGMNISILFLMSMPFTIFGSIFGAVYLTQKRAQRHGSKGLAWTQKESTK